MDLVTIPQLAFSGLTIGCVYSLVGLGFALTLRATELINFAQGEMVMLGAFIGLTLLNSFHLPYIAVFVLSVVLTGLFGVFMERFILRRILDNKSPLLNLLIATLGISIALQALAIIFWGREPMPYPDIFSEQPVIFMGIRLQHLNLRILFLGLASMVALQFFFQKTMNHHENCIGKLIGHTPVQQKLFSDYHGVVKSLGAWGGDFVLACGPTNSADYFMKKGHTTIISFGKIISRGS